MIIATDENDHVDADPGGRRARRARSSSKSRSQPTRATRSGSLRRSRQAGIDAVVGYTQRFRRRFLAVKQRLVTGRSERSPVVTRAFMNRMVPIATLRKTRSLEPHPDGRIGHAQPRHVDVADGG